MNPTMLSATLSLIIISNMQNTLAVESGKATMYDGNLYGNACGMDGTADAFDNSAYVAIGSNNFDSGYGCGKCYTITCLGPYGDNPNCECSGSITVQAIDQCPECSDSHFDLNAEALASLTGGNSDMAKLCGEVSITYERVDCSAITGNFKIINKDGTSIWWYGFHLNDVNDDGGIKSVELFKDGKSIATCTKDNGPSFWICNGLSENVPLDVKITSDSGKSVTAYNCITSLEGGAEMTCNTNLNRGSSFTAEEGDDSTSGSTIIAIVAVVILSCIAITAIIGYCIIRKQKQASAVSFDDNKEEDTQDSIAAIEDGDSTQSKASNGYDMSPIEINSTI